MRAISSMATRHVLTELSVAASDAGGEELHLESVGGVDAAKRVAAGETFDLVFLAIDALERLAAAQLVLPDSVTPLMLSQVAVAVADASVTAAEHGGGYAFADEAAMRAAMLAAAQVGYSTGPSGTALLQRIASWGLNEAFADKLVQAQPGVPVASSVAAGEVELGFQQLSELVGQPGIRILGTLPPDCAIDTVFAGAVAATSAQPGRAREALDYFASPVVAEIITAHAFAHPMS